MKKLTVLTLALFSAALLCAETAVDWQKQNDAQIKHLRDEIPALAKQGLPAFEQVFAQIKPNYATAPADSTKLAALTQYMAAQPKKARRAYADAVLKAAKGAGSPEVAVILLDQLRWCGYENQEDAVKPLLKSDDAGVKAMAQIVLAAINDDAIEFKKTFPEKFRPGRSELLARLRGTDVQAARFASVDLLATDAALLVSELPGIFKTGSDEKLTVLRDTARCLTAEQAEAAFVKELAAFTPQGRIIALDVLRERRAAGGIPGAVAAVDDANGNVQASAFRLLRDLGTAAQADLLIAKSANGEACAALAAVAKRNPDVLKKVVPLLKEGRLDYSAAALIGDDSLLPIVTEAAFLPDAGKAAGAVRALTVWTGKTPETELLRVAAGAPENRVRILAARAFLDKAKATPELRKLWGELKPSSKAAAEDAAKIDALLK